MIRNPQEDKIDPDLFEPFLTVLGALSSVGSFAIAWLQLRQDKSIRQHEMDRFQFRSQVTGLEGTFSNLFRSLREIISLFRSVEIREKKLLSDTKLGFGRATYKFTTSEFAYYQQLMGQFNNSFSQASAQCNTLIMLLNISRISGEDSVEYNLEDIHESLNDILFDSKDFEEALMKLDKAKDRVAKYIRQLENLGNGS